MVVQQLKPSSNVHLVQALVPLVQIVILKLDNVKNPEQKAVFLMKMDAHLFVQMGLVFLLILHVEYLYHQHQFPHLFPRPQLVQAAKMMLVIFVNVHQPGSVKQLQEIVEKLQVSMEHVQPLYNVT